MKNGQTHAHIFARHMSTHMVCVFVIQHILKWGNGWSQKMDPPASPPSRQVLPTKFYVSCNCALTHMCMQSYMLRNMSTTYTRSGSDYHCSRSTDKDTACWKGGKCGWKNFDFCCTKTHFIYFIYLLCCSFILFLSFFVSKPPLNQTWSCSSVWFLLCCAVCEDGGWIVVEMDKEGGQMCRKWKEKWDDHKISWRQKKKKTKNWERD